MINQVVWNTPAIVFVETVLDDGRREYEVKIVSNAALRTEAREEIIRLLKKKQYLAFPRHLFAEVNEHPIVVPEYQFVEEVDENEEVCVYRTHLYDIYRREMTMVPLVNTGCKFKKLSVVRQMMECVNSLEKIRPGICQLIINELHRIKMRGKQARRKKPAKSRTKKGRKSR